jgi:UDP-3-O-[3-hydroxymyristoyl] glucosamine N-acyltransferase
VITVVATLREQEIRDAIGVPGDGDLVVDGVAPLDGVVDRCVTFANTTPSDSARETLARSAGSIVIAQHGCGLEAARVLEVDDPRAAIAKVLGLIRDLGRQERWVRQRDVAPDAVISPHALVDEEVRIGPGVRIDAFCTVAGDVSIGAGSVVSAGARVFSHVSIGERTTIGANSVIGNPGYGHVLGDDGNQMHMPQLGGVVIGADVSVGALTIVQSGAIVPTTIEDHAKVGDYVLVGHGSRVGRNARLTGSIVVGGSSVVGEEAWVGMHASIREGRRVGARAWIGMDVSVQDDLPDDARATPPASEVRLRRGPPSSS